MLPCLLALCISGCVQKPVAINTRAAGRDSTPKSAVAAKFRRGDAAANVRAAMGAPDATLTRADGREVWNYKFSSVIFRGDRVAQWNDPSHVLRTEGPGETGEGLASLESKDGPTSYSSFPGMVLVGPAATAREQRQINPNTVEVSSYTRNDGTQVAGHIRTQGNATRSDNIRGR